MTNQYIALNNTAENLAVAWNKLYNTHDTYLTFLMGNQTLNTQWVKIQSQLTNLDTQLSSAQLLANNLIIAGLIGFAIVGLCVLGGYAIHKHIINTVNKKITAKSEKL